MDAATLQFVRERAEWRCEYCRLPQLHHGLRWHIEHIRARQHHGGDDPSNLALACPECNLRKGPNLSAVDPHTGEVVQLFNPRTQTWSEHFVWHDLKLQGRTPVGRGTVELLQLNTGDRVRMRELLRALGYILQP
jgi:hypothetical protein